MKTQTGQTQPAAPCHTFRFQKPLINVASAFLVIAIATSHAAVTRAELVSLPSNANIFGAGHTGPAATPFPGGSSPGPGPSGGSAPPTVSVSAGTTLTFFATGSIDFGGGPGPSGPDGSATSAYEFSSYNGIAGYFADRGRAALFGVFTGAVEPTDPAPPKLSFVANTNFASLSPNLNQIFFIGDGLTGIGTGSSQLFSVPAGATTLSLGLADGYPVGPNGSYLVGGYNDNTGGFLVQISAIPEASSLITMSLLGFSFAGLTWWKHQRRKRSSGLAGDTASRR